MKTSLNRAAHRIDTALANYRNVLRQIHGITDDQAATVLALYLRYKLARTDDGHRGNALLEDRATILRALAEAGAKVEYSASILTTLAKVSQQD